MPVHVWERLYGPEAWHVVLVFRQTERRQTVIWGGQRLEAEPPVGPVQGWQTIWAGDPVIRPSSLQVRLAWSDSGCMVALRRRVRA